jgi:hypothetical protein
MTPTMTRPGVPVGNGNAAQQYQPAKYQPPQLPPAPTTQDMVSILGQEVFVLRAEVSQLKSATSQMFHGMSNQSAADQAALVEAIQALERQVLYVHSLVVAAQQPLVVAAQQPVEVPVAAQEGPEAPQEAEKPKKRAKP